MNGYRLRVWDGIMFVSCFSVSTVVNGFSYAAQSLRCLLRGWYVFGFLCRFTAIRFLYNRLNTYDLPTGEYKGEEQIIHNILENNSFPICPQKPLSLKLRKHREPNPTEKQKWATFTYIGRETTFITSISRRPNIKIAFRTNNAKKKKRAIAQTTGN